MKTDTHKKKGFSFIEMMLLIAILVSLSAIGYGNIFLRYLNKGDYQMARSNLKSLHSILQEFKSNNGSFPCDATAEDMEEKLAETGLYYGPLTGETSNAYFRQLFVSNPSVSEKTFFAEIFCKGKLLTVEGDDKIANGRALESGENAMGYVMTRPEIEPDAKGGVHASGEPLAICGVFPSGTAYTGDTLQFDMSSFRGHAFVLMVDGSVKDPEKKLTRDENNDEKGMLTDADALFPKSRRGNSTSGRYVVLSPEL